MERAQYLAAADLARELAAALRRRLVAVLRRAAGMRRAPLKVPIFPKATQRQQSRAA
jgi:hypothetical protein